MTDLLFDATSIDDEAIEEALDFQAIRDGFVEMMVKKYPGLDHHEITGGFTFKTKDLTLTKVKFYMDRMIISNLAVLSSFHYSDPTCFERALEQCESFHPLNIAKGFTIEG